MAGDATLELVAAGNAPLGSADVTRRWALLFPDGVVRFPGVTRPEGQGVAGVLAGGGPEDWDDVLVAVVLPVLLSDGAGPHLLDAQGRLVLAVAEHPVGERIHVAMGSVDPADVGGATTLGLVREIGPGVWSWSARATVEADLRITALDDLDSARGPADLRAWQLRWE